MVIGRYLTKNKAGVPSTESNAVTVTMGEGVTGDVTGDGQVDIADVNSVINLMLGK